MRKIAVLLVGLCAASFVTTASAEQAKGAEPKAPEQKAAPAPMPPNGGKGKVLETMDSGGYTYVKVDLNGTHTWAAAPQFKVKKGETVVVPAGMPMAGFYSKTLKRTFDVVYFVPAVEVEGSKAKAKKK